MTTSLASGGASAPAGGIARVAWLEGCWEAASRKRTVEENWMAPRGGSMLGVSRTVRGDSLLEYELVVLREEAARLVYEAHPSGQPVAAFHSREGVRAGQARRVEFPYRRARCPGPRNG